MPVSPNASFNTVTVCAKEMIRGGFSIEPLQRTNWVRAPRLLGWRDAWYLSGWTGKVATTASARIRDLGEVENFAAEHVSPSIGERLIRVVDALQDRKVPIEEVLLFDPMEAFPKRWQDLLKHAPD